MRLVLRILGTWFLALAVVLLVIDGTRSLGANGVMLTSLAEAWNNVHQPSLDWVRAFFDSRYFAELLGGVLGAVLSYPAFAVFGVPGVVLALMGRARRPDRYIRADQI